AAPAEVADHVRDLSTGILQHLGHRSLAKIQAVILAGHDVNEPLEAVNRTKGTMYPAKSAARHGRVMRVAAQPYLALLRHRDDALEKIRDPLPHGLFANRPAFRRRPILPGPVIDEGAVAGISAPGCALGPHDTQDREVVLGRRDADL